MPTSIKWVTGVLVVLVMSVIAGLTLTSSPAINTEVYQGEKKEELITAYVAELLEIHEIPGASVVALQNGNTVYKASFGYADKEQNRVVTKDTQFELASNTKAFTALAIQSLVSSGLIDLNKPVSSYLSGLEFSFDGKVQQVTLEQFLHHTSGIPYSSIALFTSSQADDALQTDVKKLEGIELEHAPGSKFLYATINYDVLGAVIERVTGLSYEQFVTKMLLHPLGMSGATYEQTDRLATGYKRGFFKPEPYDAPRYRGNAPAAYLMADLNALERWLEIHTAPEQLGQKFNTILQAVKTPDRSVKPGTNGGYYAGGWWLIEHEGGEMSHSGSNPNFSTFFAVFPETGDAVAIMANINSENVEGIARGILALLNNQTVPNFDNDQMSSVDSIASLLAFIMVPFALICLLLCFSVLVERFNGIRKPVTSDFALIKNTSITALFVAGALLCISAIPDIFYGGVDWHVVLVWGPTSIPLALIATVAVLTTFAFYIALTMTYQKEGNKQLFTIGALGAISGIGNTFCIFTINMALHTPEPFASKLYLLFLFGVVLYVIGQKVVRTQILTLTNQTIYEMRKKMVKSILNSPFQEIEKLEKENIQVVLNNDAELVSQFPHIAITIVTSASTLLFCFVYLGAVSAWGLALSIAVICSAAILFSIAGAAANQHLEEARSIQEHFFAYINDLTSGLKELALHSAKKEHFRKDMEGSGQQYCDKNITAGTKYVNVFVMGELLFTIVVGFVAFVYPFLFTNLSIADITTFVLVFLYMTGPINAVLNNVPQIMRIKISWGRLRDFNAKLKELEPDTKCNVSDIPEQDFNIRLSNVTYNYLTEIEAKEKNLRNFGIGPISCEFKTGEITFITGGNGSGKSTLSKIITGLYSPNSGVISVNNTKMNSHSLSQLFTAIFSDYHLFKKFYGIERGSRDSLLNSMLEELQLQNIVSIRHDKIDGENLSSGQKKRLAMLVSHLDNRRVCLFDEWAADQDPGYRKYFYYKILPELRAQNKCVIVVTHDDQYFHLADKIIKMDLGKPTIINNQTSDLYAKEVIV